MKPILEYGNVSVLTHTELIRTGHVVVKEFAKVHLSVGQVCPNGRYPTESSVASIFLSNVSLTC